MRACFRASELWGPGQRIIDNWDFECDTGADLTASFPLFLSPFFSFVRVHILSGKNNLKGTIPPEIGFLTNLDRCDLAYNSITGTIPTEFGLLRKMSDLSFGKSDSF